VTRPRWFWLSLAASTLAHGAFAWQLARAPRRAARVPGRAPFEVRMVTLPPPEAPATEPPKPPPASEVAPAPKPKPKPAAPPPKPPPAPERVAHTEEPTPGPPELTTAPPAMLAESGLAAGGIVQLAGAPIGALARATAALPPSPATDAPSAPHGAPLAKLSDLSRKPRAPSLDAALRDNYPLERRRRGTEGQAEVRVVIDRHGQVGEVAVVSESAKGFAEACRRTLLGSRWSEPLDREGEPVSTRLTYRCRFQIER
jgi:protein TonB